MSFTRDLFKKLEHLKFKKNVMLFLFFVFSIGQDIEEGAPKNKGPKHRNHVPQHSGKA